MAQDETHDKLEPVLGDRLAGLRTELANGRTIMAVVRTALALAGAGVAVWKLWDDAWAAASGWLMIAASLAVLAYGVRSFVLVRRAVARAARLDLVLLGLD